MLGLSFQPFVCAMFGPQHGQSLLKCFWHHVIAPITSPCGANLPGLRRSRGWSHEVTRNVLNTNNMTDLVNDVFRWVKMVHGLKPPHHRC